jgi:hypothetical protein
MEEYSYIMKEKSYRKAVEDLFEQQLQALAYRVCELSIWATDFPARDVPDGTNRSKLLYCISRKTGMHSNT